MENWPITSRYMDLDNALSDCYDDQHSGHDSCGRCRWYAKSCGDHGDAGNQCGQNCNFVSKCILF